MFCCRGRAWDRRDPFVLAVGGRKAPRDLLRERGWLLTDPLEKQGQLKIVAASSPLPEEIWDRKERLCRFPKRLVYDRFTCYLAAQRPVLHQDTGFQDWLPAGEGILRFADLD